MANNMFADASSKRKAEQDKIIKTTENKNDERTIPQNVNKKMISAQVAISVYDKFTEINKKAGLKNNAVLNNLIWDYVSKHESEIH